MKYTKTSFPGVRKLSTGRYQAILCRHCKRKTKSFDTFGEAVAYKLRVDRESKEQYKREKEVDEHICTKYCADCKYMKWFDHYQKVMYCDYYLMKEKHRPCHAGNNCTVKETRTEDHNARMRKRYSDEFTHSKSLYKLKRERVNKNLEYTGNNC